MPSRNEGPNVIAHQPAGCDSTSVVSEREVLEQLHMYQTMFELGSLGQLIVDYRSFRIRFVNAAFCTMSGFSAAELIGSPIGMLFPIDQDPSENTVERLAGTAIAG